MKKQSYFSSQLSDSIKFYSAWTLLSFGFYVPFYQSIHLAQLAHFALYPHTETTETSGFQWQMNTPISTHLHLRWVIGILDGLTDPVVPCFNHPCNILCACGWNHACEHTWSKGAASCKDRGLYVLFSTQLASSPQLSIVNTCMLLEGCTYWLQIPIPTMHNSQYYSTFESSVSPASNLSI